MITTSLGRRPASTWLAAFAIGAVGLSGEALAQSPACIVWIDMVNHNRYAYDTDEECVGPWHSVPWGNWGVSSNVGGVRDADQFKGWRPGQACHQTRVEWNSCSVEYAKPDSGEKLNFPSSGYPWPANGYPFTDVYGHNDCAPSGCLNVDQYSPCGVNVYGRAGFTYGVNTPTDWNCDGNFDWGGCLDLHGMNVTISGNFTSLYELDSPDPDDIIQTLYYPDMSVTLNCTAWDCTAIGDANRDGWQDDVDQYWSSAYQWPIHYVDDWGNSRKRIDATVRPGWIVGFYNREVCDPMCDPQCPWY